MLEDNMTMPPVVKATFEALFARHLETLGHIECEKGAGATVWQDRCRISLGGEDYAEWLVTRYTKPKDA